MSAGVSRDREALVVGSPLRRIVRPFAVQKCGFIVLDQDSGDQFQGLQRGRVSVPVFLVQVEFLVVAEMLDASSGEHSGFQAVRSFLFLFQLLFPFLLLSLIRFLSLLLSLPLLLPRNFARFLSLSEGLPWPPSSLCLYCNTDFDIRGDRTVSGDQHSDRANCSSGK